MEFMSAKNVTDPYPPVTFLLLQYLFVIRTRGSHNDLFRCDEQCPLCRGTAVEHLLHDFLKRLDDCTLGDILCLALDLIAFQALCVVNGNRDFAVVCGKIWGNL